MTIRFELLNEKQKEAVLCNQGNVLVYAGAGSGKTRVLTNRIAYLVKTCGVDPRNILAITFTNKASKEMSERVDQLIGCGNNIWISTFHSMCTKLLRYECQHLVGYTTGFTIYSDVESQRVIKKILKDLRLSSNEELSEGFCSTHISLAKNQLMSPADYCKELAMKGDVCDNLLEVMLRYDQALKQSKAMDFDDLLYNTFLLLSSNQEVLEKYRNRFKHISVDEFQDTNKVQYEILKLLAKDTVSLFLVGDDDQSIYGWRGANTANIRGFQTDFPDGKIIKLEQNYRSTKKILAVANTIIEKSSNRHDKKLWTENEDGVNVEILSKESESEEAKFVVTQIRSLINRGLFSYSDFGILVRQNALSRSFEEACRIYGIPYRLYGGFKFYDRKEVKDITAYLRLICNPHDADAFYRIINFPKRGIGEATIEKINEMALRMCESPFLVLRNVDSLAVSPAVKTKLKDFYQFIVRKSVESLNIAPYIIVKNLVRDLDLRRVYSSDDEDKALIVDEYLDSMQVFMKNNKDADLIEFLQSVSLASDMKEDDASNSVTISTIHASKGLEFPVVFVVGLEQGIFPTKRSVFESELLEEERRLMYVAITRARKRLYITKAHSRFLYGSRNEQAPSIFYNELCEVHKPPRMVKNEYGEFIPEVRRPMFTPQKQTVDMSKLKVGSQIVHKVFGIGVIIAVNGENITVKFVGHGVKELAVKYAPITLM